MSNTVYPFNGYAPGNYMNKCSWCENMITGVDKLCFTCLDCAIKGAKDQIVRLQQWKTEAMEVLAPIDKIGKVIGLKLGESIHDKILPAIERLIIGRDLAQGRNRELMAFVDDIMNFRDIQELKEKYTSLLNKLS